jgi:hypothetical protein
MTPEQQRIAIAEACGLTIVSDGITHHLTPCGKKTEHDPEGCLLKECPDYLNDLNAMHDAEGALNRESGYNENGGYGLYLVALNHDVSAPAEERAEAFLRTLNLWTE